MIEGGETLIVDMVNCPPDVAYCHPAVNIPGFDHLFVCSFYVDL